MGSDKTDQRLNPECATDPRQNLRAGRGKAGAGRRRSFLNDGFTAREIKQTVDPVPIIARKISRLGKSVIGLPRIRAYDS
jgi:hypothetical protein